MSKEKKEVKKNEKKYGWEAYSKKELKELETLNVGYREYLDLGKTERECVTETVKQAKAAGYVDLQEVIASGKKLTAGDKVYAVCMNKTIVLVNIGTESLEKGMNILGAHIDSPRLDL